MSSRKSRDSGTPHRVQSMNSTVRPQVQEKGPKVPKKPKKYRPGSIHLDKILTEELDKEARRPSFVEKVRRKISIAPIEDTEEKSGNPIYENTIPPPPPGPPPADSPVLKTKKSSRKSRK